jgi:hypothetical protein
MDRKSTNPTNPTEGRAAGHTPGPWHVVVERDKDESETLGFNWHNAYVGTHPTNPRGGQHVCRILGWGADYTRDEEQQANASLIAAAPMLLEAARAALLACESELEWRGECDQDYEPDYQMTPLVTVLRAAIAAAEGQS